MTTVGIAMYTGIMSYIVDGSVSILPARFGTFADETYMAEYTKLITSKDYDEYAVSFKRLQELNAEMVPAIALSISRTYAPYRTDRITGWVNYPAWGVINPTTWYNITSK
jgi:peptide/nickel transport system substrate-binding protein